MTRYNNLNYFNNIHRRKQEISSDNLWAVYFFFMVITSFKFFIKITLVKINFY